MAKGNAKRRKFCVPWLFQWHRSILGGLLLEDAGQDGKYDGRFAIVLRREWGDLRQLIDLRMGIKDISDDKWREREKARRMYKGPPPFSDRYAKKMMLEIAMGVRQLHNHDIMHRDVKSANLLVSGPHPGEYPIEDDAFHVKVFDFESSVGVVGRAFWKAPAIPQALNDDTHRDFIFTTKQDVYSYAMTCYEILTGHLPFEYERPVSGRGIVINGGRPDLPHGMDKWLKVLIEKCWREEPSERPEFEEVVQTFKDNLSDPRAQRTLEEQIKASKPHWSQKGGNLVNDHPVTETNQEIFSRLKVQPKYANFFSYEFLNLERGRKIGEGAQAEIFEAEFEKENRIKVPCVMKLFKSGFSLEGMVKQWPPGMFKSRESPFGKPRFGFMGLYRGATRTCEVLGATVWKDDRFTFILMQEGGDLRALIDDRMKQHNNKGPPFSIMFATRIMHEIALGMQHLHDHDILHRDLKASNVLVTKAFGEFPTEVNTELMDIKVADFECSMFVKGTSFFRAPEILKQLRAESQLRGQERIDFRLHFTEEADVYSYGMTCYEVLTGGTPLLDEKIGLGDYEAV